VLNHIPQRYLYDCGIAVAAMLAEATYEQARAAYAKRMRSSGLNLPAMEARALILYRRDQDQRHCGHWVASMNGWIYDPSPRRIRPTKYKRYLEKSQNLPHGEAAKLAGVSRATAERCVACYRKGGVAALRHFDAYKPVVSWHSIGTPWQNCFVRLRHTARPRLAPVSRRKPAWNAGRRRYAPL
jgi:hypothetical protein